MNDYAGNGRRVLRSRTVGAAKTPVDTCGILHTGGV
jgi:hypothetical protein